MKAYYFDNIPGDKRLPHESTAVSVEALRALNIITMQIPVQGHEERIDVLAKERDYKNRDVINVSKEGLGDVYEEKLESFFHEHLHEDEEIRYCLEGGGFFDVREMPNDKWIRIAFGPGDLLIVPAGIYHRFTLDEGNAVKAMRLFKDAPKWIPHNRGEETDENPIRVDYLKSIGIGL